MLTNGDERHRRNKREDSGLIQLGLPVYFPASGVGTWLWRSQCKTHGEGKAWVEEVWNCPHHQSPFSSLHQCRCKRSHGGNQQLVCNHLWNHERGKSRYFISGCASYKHKWLCASLWLNSLVMSWRSQFWWRPQQLHGLFPLLDKWAVKHKEEH